MHDDAALARYARALSAAAASSALSVIDTLATITAMLARRDGLDVVFDDERAVARDATALPALPDGVAPAIVLATAREALLAPASRRRNGAHYTPYRVARRLSAIALDRLPFTARTAICDPAVGGGIFLVAVADELEARGLGRAEAVECLWGADVDPVSVAVARTALRLWAGAAPQRDERGIDGLDERVAVGDPLLGGRAVWPAHEGGFGLVIGNPPFLNQLQRASSRTRTDAQTLVERFGEAARGYVDSSALFMLTGLELVQPDGLVLLIQPQSCLSARDSEGVRRVIDARATVEGLWFSRDRVFEASVRVCAPIIRAARRDVCDVARWVDREVVPAPSLSRVRVRDGESKWSSLIDDLLGIPPVTLAEGQDLAGIGCRATSGFRDQFYGFVDATHERGDRPDAAMRLVTVGMIDPLGLGWGTRPSRFARRDFCAPVVDLDELDDRMRVWADARNGPKLLVATQTKVIEVAVDERGDCLPLTPVIELRPPDGSLWRLAAALTNPVATAVACRLGAGSALAIDAIKLSARQLLSLPVPLDDELWARGAELAEAAAVATATGSGDRVALLRELGATMCGAYLQPVEPLTGWWLARLPKVS
ncbi:MAG: N-6 DNA methylase [Acidimicrobiales bacterium]